MRVKKMKLNLRYLIANYAFLICACKITGNWVAIALIVVLAKSRITITVLLNCV